MLRRHSLLPWFAGLLIAMHFGVAPAAAAEPYDPWPGLAQDIFNNRAMNDGAGVIADKRIVDKSIPLDLTAEVHTRADRITVELRRVLADLVTEAAK